MSEFTDAYLGGLQAGMVKTAGPIGRLATVLGALGAASYAGKNYSDEIAGHLPVHAGIGAGVGAVTGGLIASLKDSKVPGIDPNAMAMMSPEQRAAAQDVQSSERSKERNRRILGGAVKGGLGGGTLGALTATGSGIMEGLESDGIIS